MSFLKRFLDQIIHGAFQASVLLCLPAIALCVAYDVFVRFFFNSSIQGMNELVAFMLLVFFLLGLPRVVVQGQLVNLQLTLPKHLPRVCHVAYDILVRLFFFVCWMSMYGLLAWQAYVYGIELWEFEETLESWSFPIWPIAIVMVTVFIVLMCRMLVSLTFGGSEALVEPGEEALVDE